MQVTKIPPNIHFSQAEKRAKANDTSPQGGDKMGCFICQCLMASEILKVTKGNWCILENPEQAQKHIFIIARKWRVLESPDKSHMGGSSSAGWYPVLSPFWYLLEKSFCGISCWFQSIFPCSKALSWSLTCGVAPLHCLSYGCVYANAEGGRQPIV